VLVRRLVEAPRAASRIELARRWLASRPADAEVLVVVPSVAAGADLVRGIAAERGAFFGWHHLTLGALAARLAAPELARRGLAAASPLAIEALCIRVVHALGDDLGPFQAIADRPGLPRALARTLLELRSNGIDAVPDALGRLLEAVGRELDAARIADRATVMALAAEAARRGEGLVGLPTLFVDVPLGAALERDLCAALVERSPDVLALQPTGDTRALALFAAALGVDAERSSDDGDGSALARLQRHLFGATAVVDPLDHGVVVLSAPGESRECVEIARAIRREADAGVSFDRMAVFLHAPEQYRGHLEEALRRADVPAHFARGGVRPDPTGRALLALLACAAEGLSARRFAEYLSLGEVPEPQPDGEPPPAWPATERWTPPAEEHLPRPLADTTPEEPPSEPPGAVDPETAAVPAGTLRAPRRWEQLLVEAAVINGLDRWKRRLAGLRADLGRRLEHVTGPEPDETKARRFGRDIADLDALRAYALPLLAELERLPAAASWGRWLDVLGALATRALRRPERVLAVLAELRPLAPVGPVDLRQVRLTLEPRLTRLLVPPPDRRYGKVLVAPTEAARGQVFDVVFVPGLAERVFPQKVLEDPMLRDADRARVAALLETNEDRVARERLSLHLAVGAATSRAVLSYPRLDLDAARPRVPSFYALEVLRAATGRLPGFEELGAQAARGGAERIGWPAPALAADAIDDAEYDLALLDDLARKPDEETLGCATYLLDANVHLGRALRFRGRRWRRRWSKADGLVDPDPEAARALEAHRLAARSYSPTALQSFAVCPYRFLLHAIFRLSPREAPEEIEELDPLQRGSLVHDVQFELLGVLRDEQLLPVTRANLPAARAHLERVLRRVADERKEELCPAIERVWQDAIAGIEADLREWLERMADDPSWVPWRFELAFGLRGFEHRGQRDPGSSEEDVRLDEGIRLRGSIDLVERAADGTLRATDHKTGRVRAKENAVIEGGQILQPVLYALALEKLFAGQAVAEGRLYYCTSTGGFQDRRMPLDETARLAAARVAETIDGAIAAGFLPAFPGQGQCRWCDYQVVCGPWEEQRTRSKPGEKLVPLQRLRSMR
jgi:RecB family exonuclease